MAMVFRAVEGAYRLIVALWNASIVLLQVLWSVMQEAKQEAAEVMALLDDGTSMMDAIKSTSLLLDSSGPTSPWQMLVIVRGTSFVLLLRLSKHRILYLEVDEMFIVAKLEVIRTELMLNIQHVPRLLQLPIGTHNTQLARYVPTRLPYIWKEERASVECKGGTVGETVEPAAGASLVRAGSEGRSHRKKYVQLLTEGALRRRLHMDRRGGLGGVPRRGMSVTKSHGENVSKRKALANATNAGVVHAEESTDAEAASDMETMAAETPKQIRMERNIHTALSENLSIPNMVQATSSRKAVKYVQQLRRSESHSLRRKRGQFDLYSQGISSEFSLLSKMNQGRD